MLTRFLRWLFGPPDRDADHPLKATPLYNSFSELEEQAGDRPFID